jgi:hypothetical protein
VKCSPVASAGWTLEMDGAVVALADFIAEKRKVSLDSWVALNFICS